MFPVNSEHAKGFRIASETTILHSVIWGCAIRIASHIVVASRDSGH